MAIARVTPELRGYNSVYIVGELKKLTGRAYGYNAQKWNKWWEAAKTSWQIPEDFLKPWDEQQDPY